MDEIVAEFLVESTEGLDSMDQHLLALEERPDDTGLLTEVFRTLHTIKGTCGFFGFARLEQLAHAGENLLAMLRDGDLSMTPAIADALLATVDAVRDILATIGRTEDEGVPDIDDLVSLLESFGAEHGGGEPPMAPAGGELGPTAERIGDRLVGAGVADRTDVEIAAAEQALGDDRPIGRILVEDGRAEPAEVESAVAGQTPSAADATIRVDVGLLDRLMNLVGELVLSRNQIIQLADNHEDDGFGPPAQRLNLITSELQEGVMKTRMQPINSAWAKLPRIVRDISHQLGKSIRVEMVGKDTELDRTIIEAIKDPLTHIVRNSLDHGIETPDEREAAGKDREGRLLLRASHQGGQVNIEISDDGRGIAIERVRAKALERGLIDQQAASTMLDSEIVQMIFRPGFSTAGEVTNVSGRGVGMDVVKTNVERIGGSVDVKTDPGAGTTFTIKIPLTLAIIPALTVTCGGNRYAIPQVNLLELVRLASDERWERIEDLHGAPVYRLRGELLPIVDLRQQLGADQVNRETTNIVVLRADDCQFGLIVDAIEDTGEIVVKPLGKQVKDLKLFSGATIMGDGRIALILDLLGLAANAGLLGSGQGRRDGIGDSGDGLTDARALDQQAVVLLGIGPNERVAIPLANVERLEVFPTSAIEQSEGRPVVQYRQSIMPLVDLGRTLGLAGTALDQPDWVSVVVCPFNGRMVGLAVRQIVDIVHSEAVEITDEARSVVVHDLVTDVVDVEDVISRELPFLQVAGSRAVEPVEPDGWQQAGEPAHHGAGAGR